MSDDAARLCVEHPATGRLFEIGERLDAWLHGDLDSPGRSDDWPGDPVDDIGRDELLPTGPHNYLLTATHADTA
ncbi:hypothetical protein [Nocardia sp. NPDC050710]|uniref:hypothetical protein n=1 Tax=Nocardia sp. NPDC050710 TaxID=3157220 RepID=UPI00340D634A